MEQSCRAPHWIYEKNYDGSGHGQQRQPEQRLPQCLGDHGTLQVYRLDQVHHQSPLGHLGGEILIDVVEVKRADDPPYRDVSQDLAEVEPLNMRTVSENCLPDKVV